jgi:DNA-binding transcriptional regulator LsrR (DeoR family)
VLEADAIAQLAALGAVGDLVVHPFDASGRFVAPDLADRAVAIGVDELREVGRVMAVAAGIEKTAAIRGALATGLVDILVTDAETARAVMVLP